LEMDYVLKPLIQEPKRIKKKKSIRNIRRESKVRRDKRSAKKLPNKEIIYHWKALCETVLGTQISFYRSLCNIVRNIGEKELE